MADTVTYADVRFVKHPKAPENPLPSTALSQTGDIIYANVQTQGRATASVRANNDIDENGEVTYARIKCVQKSAREPIPGGSGTWHKAWWRALAPYTTHILLATSLLLLVTTVALGVRLFQVSALVASSTQSLQELQEEKEALRTNLDQVTRTFEKTQDSLRGTKQLLEQTQEQLHRTEEELRESEERLRYTEDNLRSREQELENSENILKKTTEELQKSKKENIDLHEQNYSVQESLNKCNSDLQKCQNDLRTTRRSLTTATNASNKNEKRLNQLTQDLKNAEEILTEGKYFAATPCMNILLGIVHFSESTYSFQYCQSGWTLISGKCFFFSEVEKSRAYSEHDCTSVGARLAVIKPSNTNLQEFIKGTKQEYWVGLKRTDSGRWEWSDGTKIYSLSDWADYTCMKMADRLNPENCYEMLPYICEKPASTCAAGGPFQDCFGNKKKKT